MLNDFCSCCGREYILEELKLFWIRQNRMWFLCFTCLHSLNSGLNRKAIDWDNILSLEDFLRPLDVLSKIKKQGRQPWPEPV